MLLTTSRVKGSPLTFSQSSSLGLGLGAGGSLLKEPTGTDADVVGKGMLIQKHDAVSSATVVAGVHHQVKESGHAGSKPNNKQNQKEILKSSHAFLTDKSFRCVLYTSWGRKTAPHTEPWLRCDTPASQ